MSVLDNPEHSEWTGFMYTDCVRAMNCPRCGALYDNDCRQPNGRKTWPPHSERLSALDATGYTANRKESK